MLDPVAACFHWVTFRILGVMTPNNFTAAAGDIIAFEFVTVISHSVVQSSFNNPCIRSGFDSGTHIANEGTGQPYVFNYTVADTSPVWLFCDVSTHCKEGMVAAINPPTSGDQTFAAFLAKAEARVSREPRRSRPRTPRIGVARLLLRRQAHLAQVLRRERLR
ncbi:uncharacterized protein EI90DRAFT_2032283 [Cantharellus anzutake]|uniref:uncharacterized protein n=1 Tax=Cantharellus anzutake TaxID=1750568 RepID=UPI00190301EE|nr:uncharacterized protein EI90DRAFT_2032283 [Cantharellus anzutake]KAF8325894.1 hypothetical protein EI90DRAFT_2032283 [Cantharellus anzutake]